MKNLLIAIATGLIVVGCQNNSNPLSPDAQTVSATNAQRAIADNGGAKKARRIEGTITDISLNDGVVVINNTKIQTTVNTKVERNNQHATLKDFRLGDFGQATLDPVTSIATKVEAKG